MRGRGQEELQLSGGVDVGARNKHCKWVNNNNDLSRGLGKVAVVVEG